MIARNCWCGQEKLQPFSPEYSLCPHCQTLISQVGLTAEQIIVKNDDEDFYGKNYWLSHQNQDLGFPDIHQRARNDLSERCLHWLLALLKYKLPPAKLLEIGCAHGGFVALAKQAGYDATGLELSPWVAEFARQTFNIPVLVGIAEEHNLELGTYDVICLLDVMEHLSDPRTTLQHCLKLLKPEGVLIIQTPCYPKDKSHHEMQEQKNRFLEVMKGDEHLYLFSQSAAQKIFHELGADHIQFEHAIFDHYDMFFMVSRVPLVINTQEAIDRVLNSSGSTRILQATIDVYMKYRASEIAREAEKILLYKKQKRSRLLKLIGLKE